MKTCLVLITLVCLSTPVNTFAPSVNTHVVSEVLKDLQAAHEVYTVGSDEVLVIEHSPAPDSTFHQRWIENWFLSSSRDEMLEQSPAPDVSDARPLDRDWWVTTPLSSPFEVITTSPVNVHCLRVLTVLAVPLCCMCSVPVLLMMILILLTSSRPKEAGLDEKTPKEEAV